MKKSSPIILVAGLFAVYLILKWTCRLLFGVLDYAILIGIVMAVIWYIRLPKNKKFELWGRITSSIRYLGQKLRSD